MHVFTDSKVALREAVTKPSKRLSSWELLNLAEKDNVSFRRRLNLGLNDSGKMKASTRKTVGLLKAVGQISTQIWLGSFLYILKATSVCFDSQETLTLDRQRPDQNYTLI